MNEQEFYPLEISNIRPETDTAVCLTFAIPDQLKTIFNFTQGQYLVLKHEINGEEVRRSYSICSKVGDRAIQVGIKRVSGGKFSNYANDNFKLGDTVLAMPPQGEFFTKLMPENKKNYMCIAAGSGITPILSIINSILSIERESEVTLIYGNKKSSSILFKDDLSFIKNHYLKRFSWINILSQEDQGSDVQNGIIDNQKGAQLHKNKLINIFKTDDVFICGPESMMSEVSRGFRSSGFEDSRIHYELFANSSEDAELILEKAQKRVSEYGEEKTSKVTIVADGRTINFELTTVGENILDAGVHNGLDLPYACKAGVCSTCKAKLIKGKVDMDITHGLESHEIAAGYILTCQAHPISDEVVVDYDQRK